MRFDLQRILRRVEAKKIRKRGPSSKIAATHHFENDLNFEPLERRLMLAAATVVSINRSVPTAQDTALSSVTYAVTFNSAVSNVLAADFRVTINGNLGYTAPLVVAGSGSSYTVTISGIHGSGDLRLDLVDDDSIIGGSPSGPLGGSGVGNGSFQGQTYTVSQAFPYVTSINRSSPAGSSASGPSVTYAVNFSEPVTGVDPTDFTTVDSGVTNTTPLVVAGSGSSYTVTVNGITGSGTLGLNLVDDGTIRDASGNPLIQSTLPISLAAPTTKATGTDPITVVAADLRGIGREDLIVVNNGTNNAQVFLSNGNGTFQTPVSYSVGSGPNYLAIADINGDGKPDMITANGNSNNLSIRLGNGDGTFGGATTISTGNIPTSLAVVDVSGDGKPDLIYTNIQDNTVSVRLNTGGGTFGSATNYTTGNGGGIPGENFDTIFVAVADVNGDGKPDLVVANVQSNTVSVLLNNGSGGFGGQTQFTVGPSPVAVAIADVNGDGKPDILVANTGDVNGNGSCLGVLLGTGTGSFGAQTTYTTGIFPASIVVTDVNGDGKPDVIVADSGVPATSAGSNMGILLGNGNGTFAAQTTFTTGVSPGSAAVADLNGDGRGDIYLANFTDNTMGLYLNNGNGNFTGQVYTITGVTGPVVDLNGPVVGTGYSTVYSTVTGPVSVADASQATITDTNSITSMTLGLSSAQTGDVLAANTTGTSITQVFAGGTLTLSGSDTAAHYQQVLRTVTYNNTGGVPAVASETVRVFATDSGAVTSPEVDATIAIDAAAPVVDLNGPGTGSTGFSANWTSLSNVAVSITDPTATVSDSDSSRLSSLTAAIASPSTGDVLSANTTGTAITQNFAGGVLTLSGSDTVANYQQVLSSVQFNTTTLTHRTVTINVQANDDGLLASTAATSLVSVDPQAPVTDLNGPGTGGNNFSAPTWNNTGPVAITDPTAAVTDADSATLSSLVAAIASPSAGDVLSATPSGGVIVTGIGTATLTLSGSASAAAYSTVLASVTFDTTTVLPNRTVTINFTATDDGAFAGNTAAATINLVTNTAPTVDLNGAAAGSDFTASWSGSSAVAITDAANATVTDDGTTLASMTVKLTSPATGDVLAANTTGTSITQSYSAGTLTLSGVDTLADYQTVLRTVTYNNTNNGPGVAVETATVVANDGFLNSAAATSTINMPAPSLSLTAGSGSGAPNFTTTWYNQGTIPMENNVLATVTALSGVPTLSSIKVTLATFHTGDVLALAPLGGVSLALTSSYSAGTLTLSGTDTVAHYQQALRFIDYNNTSGGPGATPIVATFVANDGTHSSNLVTSTININVGSGQVLGNRLFYNNSKYDVNSGAINANDDLAIASDKTGYNGTGTATFANVSAFNKGITGIMVDLQSGLGAHSLINLTSGDISFKVSPATFVTTTFNQLSTWSAGPTPAAVSVRIGAGQGGSDRLEITFGTSVVKNEWIEVNVHSGGNTGLSANDVFYFGSIIGDSGAADTALLAKTDGNDYNVPFNNIVGLTTPVWNLADYTKDGKVDGNDASTAISNVFTLHYLANPTGPFAPNGGGSAAPAASPAASPASITSVTPSAASNATGAIFSGLGFLNTLPINASAIHTTLDHVLSSPPVTKAIQTTLQNPQLLQAVEQIASQFNAHEDALDGLLKDLGLE